MKPMFNHHLCRMQTRLATLLVLVSLGLARTFAAGDLSLIVYNPGHLKPVDSHLKVKVGDRAPDFTLPRVQGGEVSLKQFRGQKNVVISFVPAAFTPICSAQWPGYNLVLDMFTKHDAVLLGISTDNLPSLYAWTQEMGGISFDILSDFYPHGKVADAFGVLRSDGMAERVRTLAPDGVDAALDVAGSGVLPELIDLAGGSQNVVTLADFGGAKQHGVRFSNGFHGHAFHALTDIGALIAAGRFWLPVERTYPLDEISEAHRVSELGHVRGRLVLVIH